MTLSREADKATLEAFLLQQPAVNIYAIGDLDPSCWGDCVWDVLRETDADGNVALRSVALTYRGLAVPVLQVLANPQDPTAMDAARRVLELLAASAPERLPMGTFEAHLNAGLEAVLRDAGFRVDPHPHLRMVLGVTELAQLQADSPPQGLVCTVKPQRLTPADANACKDLSATLERSWFEPQCLDSGIYYGVYGEGDDAGTLLAMGGTHVASIEYRVAALGNIATRTSHRRKGYGRMVVHALCLALSEQGIETIGLNVTAGNTAAIAMYQALHFRTVMEFVECDVAALRAERQAVAEQRQAVI